MKKTLTIIFSVLILSNFVLASGFQINEHGARAMSLGGAFTGLANDASAVFFNPAGITQLNGTNFMGGVTLIQPISSFRGPSPSIAESKLEDQVFTPINLYITHKINDDLSAGFSVNNPYGLGTKWDPDWVGRYLAIETEIRTFYFTGVLAYKISDQLSVGAGAVFAYGDVIIARKTSLTPFAGEALIHLEGDGSAFGFTAGLLYNPIPEVSFGINYRSQADIEFEGDGTATGPEQAMALLPTGSISAPLSAPSNLVFGLAVNAMENLTITADIQFVGWSSYDKLQLTFNDVFDENGDKLVETSIRDYENSFISRLGCEYKLNEEWDLRAGVLYDVNPVSDERVDPTLPDSDRLGLNVGFGYKITENISLDLAYFFLRFDERKITNSLESYSDGAAPFNGVYNSTAHLFGINFSYKL